MLLELLAASGASGGRLFNAVPYVGAGGVRALKVGVDAPALAFLNLRTTPNQRAFYDTVRGDSKRIILDHANEDVSSAFAFSGKDRVYTGTSYNLLGSQYDSWHAAVRARFLDIVAFSGGATGIAHALTEAPTFALVLRRTGSAGPAAVMGIIGSGQYIKGSAVPPSVGEIFSSVTGSAFTPNAAWASSSCTYVVYLFSGGLGRVVTGSYVGTVPEDTVGNMNITLPMAPTIMLLWGKQTSTSHGTALLYPNPASTGLEDWFLGAALEGNVVGTTLGVSSRESNIFTHDHVSSCLSGETYRYVIFR